MTSTITKVRSALISVIFPYVRKGTVVLVGDLSRVVTRTGALSMAILFPVISVVTQD